MSGRNPPRGNAVEQVEPDVHQAGKGQTTAKPVFRVVVFDAESLRIIGLRIAASEKAGDASPEGVRLALLPYEPCCEKIPLHLGQFGNGVGFNDGAGRVLRMEGFHDAHAVLLRAFPRFADAAVIQFDGGVRGSVPCEEAHCATQITDSFVLENSHNLKPEI